MSKNYLHNYQELANSIILVAVEDYKVALELLKAEPNEPTYKRQVKKLEKFFLSEYYSILTSIDGQTLINRLRGER